MILKICYFNVKRQGKNGGERFALVREQAWVIFAMLIASHLTFKSAKSSRRLNLLTELVKIRQKWHEGKNEHHATVQQSPRPHIGHLVSGVYKVLCKRSFGRLQPSVSGCRSGGNQNSGRYDRGKHQEGLEQGDGVVGHARNWVFQ